MNRHPNNHSRSTINDSHSKTLKEPPLVLRVEDLAQMLSIGRNTAYELVRSGEIRSIRIGKSYRIPREAIEEYLSNHNDTP